MDNQIDKLYHLTNIENCKQILLDGKIRPRNHGTKAANGVRGNSAPGNFVHCNFCPKAPMLWYLYQGRCLSADRIFGQADAVYLELALSIAIFNLNLCESNSFTVTDCDVSVNGYRWKQMNGDDIDHCMGAIAGFVDVSEINQVVNTIDAVEHPKKGAEFMVEREVDLDAAVLSIGVHDSAAQNRLLTEKTISRLYGDKVFIKPEWYF